MMIPGPPPDVGGDGWVMTFVERDRWYLVVDCKRCQRSTVISEVAAADNVASRAPLAFSWKFPHRGKRQILHPDQVECCQGLYIQPTEAIAGRYFCGVVGDRALQIGNYPEK
jgi:hypothetical protein